MAPNQWWGGDSEDPGLEPEESFGVIRPFPIIPPTT
jgi:hypothetical protein